MATQWNGRVAVVTGASSGIGQATARELLRRGARVGLIARSAERLAAAADGFARDALVLPADVRDRDAVHSAIRAVVERWGRLDLLVYSAGVSRIQRIDQIDDAARETLETNALGAVWAIQAALPAMRRDRFGRIVLLASVDAHVAPVGFASYAMSKWGLRALAASLRAELRGTGIRVSLVSPYYVRTAMLDVELADAKAAIGGLPWFSPRAALGSDAVAAAVLRAAETGAHEYVLAPPLVRLGLVLGTLFPGLLDHALAREARSEEPRL